jgi:anti-sigma factor (TIGR02949 family)
MIDRLRRLLRREPSCAEVMEVLQAYLDGEVDDSTARMVAEHLGVCLHCSHESDVYQRIKTKLASRRREIDPQVRVALETFVRGLPTSAD